MANEVTVKITGLEELQKKLLDQLPNKAKSAMRSALRDGAKVIQEAIVQEAPKDSGFLSEHIDVRTRVKGSGLTGSAFVGPNSKEVYPQNEKSLPGKKSRPKPASVVARFLEFGTATHSANAFMTRAFESTKQNAIDAVLDRLKKVLGL